MELLKIHPVTGQWSLEKQYTSPKVNDGGMQSPAGEDSYAGARAKTYRSTTGSLREDHGQKGSVHGNPGNKRAPKQGLPAKYWGKPHSTISSAAVDAEPGLL